MDKNKQGKKSESSKGSRLKSPLSLIVIAIVVAFVATLVLIGLSGENDDGGLTSGGEPTGTSELEQTTSDSEVYDPCKDESLEEKPTNCNSYPFEFLFRFRNQPDNCWIAVDGFAYDVTQREGGYEYNGEGTIDQLCGRDLSENFKENQISPPDREYLRGVVSP